MGDGVNGAFRVTNSEDDQNPHRIPAIDRMMDVLEVLERRPAGASMRELVEIAGISRSTVYRLLNSLEAHAMVTKSDNGSYRLGSRLLQFSAAIAVDATGFDLTSLAGPHLEKLCRISGESCRISVLDRGTTLVLAVAQGTREYALTAKAGQRLPLHAGAASKILLGSLSGPERDALLSHPLQAFTDHTFTDQAALAVELSTIRHQGWSHDGGEFSTNVHSFGAPVLDSAQRVIAAVSSAYLAGKTAEEADAIRRHVIAAAEDI
ncbi:MAG: IclR family transcriptional regulator, partial [Hyphomicrobiales bacterium]